MATVPFADSVGDRFATPLIIAAAVVTVAAIVRGVARRRRTGRPVSSRAATTRSSHDEWPANQRGAVASSGRADGERSCRGRRRLSVAALERHHTDRLVA